jgi:hypothetical protein
MNQYSVVPLGLTAGAVLVVMLLIFAVLRLSAAARGARRRLRETGSETALLSMALQDAVAKLKAQEHAMSIRAIASEQLNGQIVDSLTAGLLVVDRAGLVEILSSSTARPSCWRSSAAASRRQRPRCSVASRSSAAR